MVLLDRHRAIKFLEDVGIVDGEALLARDPLIFINTLIGSFMTRLPFQCVSLMAQTVEERHVPSLEEVVEAGLSLEGGICFTLNVFMGILLRTFGFHVQFLDGSYSASKDHHTHIVLLVKDLRSPEDDHFIDVGGGHPFLAAVAVDSLPVTFHQAGLKYTYCRRGDLVLRFHHENRNPETGQDVVAKEGRQVFHFSLNPVDFEDIRSNMDKVYVYEERSVCLQGIRAVRFPPADEIQTEDIGIIGTDTNEKSLDNKQNLNEEIEKTSMNKRDSGKKSFEENDKDDFQPTSGARAMNVETKDKNLGKELEARKSAELSDDRIMVAMKDQSLLLGRVDAATKTKVCNEKWTATLKNLFPTIPPAKVNLAVLKMIQKQS